MNSFARETACALAVTVGLWTPVARGQSTDQKSVSVQPGERRAAPLPPPAQGSIPLTLDRAIGLALANNEDLNVSINTAEAFRYSIVANTGIFDPLIQAALSRSHSEQPASSTLVGAAVRTADATDFSASVSQLLPTGGTLSLGFVGENLRTNSTFQTTNPSKTASGTFSFTQPLLRNFGHDTTTWLIRISKNTSDGSYQDLVRAVQNTVNSVEQAYWDLAYALQNLEVKKESLRIAQDLNRITKIKIDVGSLAPIDITQTEVGIATAEQDIILAEGLIGDAQDRLKRQLNFDRTQWSIPILPTDQVRAEPVQVKVDDGMTLAISTRPEILKEAYLVDSDRIRYDYWSNQVLPQLNFVGSYGAAGLAGTFFSPDPTDPTGRRLLLVDQTGFGDAYSDVLHVRNKSWSLGINFSYPLFNRAARGQRGAARYTWESDKSFLTTIRQNVVVEVRAAARAIDTAARSILAASKGRELAEKNLDAEKKKFDNGMSTTFQVNQIQRDLSVARTNELQALAGYRKALAAYHLAVADNLSWKGIQIEGLPNSAPPPMPQMVGTR
jgi:outer membrane protein TolC